MDYYSAFDDEIFEITRIMVGLTLSDGQRRELAQVVDRIEAAYQAGDLNNEQRGRLLDNIADCGMELPAQLTRPDTRQPSQRGKKKQKSKEHAR